MVLTSEKKLKLKNQIIKNIISKTSVKDPAYAEELARKWADLT